MTKIIFYNFVNSEIKFATPRKNFFCYFIYKEIWSNKYGMNGQSKDASYLEKPLNYQMILLKHSLKVIPTSGTHKTVE